MPKARQPNARKGYEPGMGFPDPADLTQQEAPVLANITHYADGSRGGPVCGIRPMPTEANAYDPHDPTCPVCADWLGKTREHTQRAHGPHIAASQAMADAAAKVARAGGPRPSKAPPVDPPSEPKT